MKKILIILFVFAACRSLQTGNPSRKMSSLGGTPYCGCLFFIDDFRTHDELNLTLDFAANFLIRSWYRWGDEPEEKQYRNRQKIVSKAKEYGIGVGGGSSLSIVSKDEFTNGKFSRSWLAIDLDGKEIKSKKYFNGTLSSPGFRSYLIRKLVDQARLGIEELHLGETNGAIFFDKWTRENFGIWIKNKYPGRDLSWWDSQFGRLGRILHRGAPPSLSDIKSLTGRHIENFWLEWGDVGSWKGLNKKGDKAFLYNAYHRNLDLFISELRSSLKTEGLEATIDVWGFADWISGLSSKPDAVFASPPDQRWGLNWELDANFDLAKSRESIITILKKELRKIHPIPLIMMIDHPKPFYEMANFSDKRQRQLYHFFSEIAEELGANFVVRSYSHKPANLGPKTKVWLKTFCKRQKEKNFCPSNKL